MLNKNVLSKVVITYNVLFLLTGFAAVAVGIWMIFEPGLLDVFYGIYKFLHPSSLLIGAGLLTILTTFCGIGGAHKENRCFLRTYLVFLCLVLIVEFAAGGIGFSYRTMVNSEISNNTITYVQKRYGHGDRELDYAVDLMQEKFECCGAEGKEDWEESDWFKQMTKLKKKTVPESCCKEPKDCAQGTNSSQVFSVGCRSKLQDFVSEHYLVIGGFGVGIGGLQLLGVVLAYLLQCALNQDAF